MTIEKYVHRCIIQDGDLAGNDFTHEIEAYEIEYAIACNNCGHITTEREIIAHMYEQLTQ